jgi:hypothetical protein
MKKRPVSKTHENLNVIAAELLVMSAHVVANPPPNIPATGIAASRTYVDGVLAGAKARGYTQTDVLRAMLADGQTDARVVEMTRAACRAAGFATVNKLIASLPA